MPPPGALIWPSSEEPTPKAITGTRCVGAGPHDLLHLVRRLGQRRRRPAPASGYRWWCARAGRGSPGPVCKRSPKLLLQDAEHGRDAFLVAFDRIEVAQSHEFLREWTSVARLLLRSAGSRSLPSDGLCPAARLCPAPATRKFRCPSPPPSSPSPWTSRRTGSTTTAISTWPTTTCCSTAARTRPSRRWAWGRTMRRAAAHHLHGRSPCLLRAGAASRPQGHGLLPAHRP